MEFVVKECIFLAFFLFLSLGAFGAVTEPFIKNTIASSDTDPTAAFVCATSLSALNLNWSTWPVGGQSIRAVASGINVGLEDTNTFGMLVTEKTELGNNVSRLFIRIVNASTAGVYTCDEGQKQSAQFIVIFAEESVCNLSSKPNEKRSSGEEPEWSCTIKYAANASYVVANVKWSIFGSSESLKSSMETSTSANITTATSTLKMARPENSMTSCASIYICTTTFSLTDDLPSGFVTKEPEYARACSPNVDACEEKYEPVCNLAPEPNEKRPRDEISQLFCTLKYAADAYYVVDSVEWSIDGSTQEIKSSMETSTSANITTAISTLNITTSENLRCASIYRCTTAFRMTDKLPRGLLFVSPDYERECSLSVPNAVACKGEKTDKKTTENSDNKPGKTSVETPGRHSSEKSDRGKSTISSGNSDEKSTEKSGETPGVTPGKNAGGSSFGSSKRNIVMICVVGIAGLLLIGTGTGV